MDQMLEKSLADAAAKMPYYSRGFAALTPVLREGLGTCGVDTSWRLYYDPVFLSLKSFRFLQYTAITAIIFNNKA